jgi:hypothetical protein
MKTEGEIRRKLQQAQYRHVKKILRTKFRHLGDGEWPSNEVESIKSDYKEFFSVSPTHVIAQQFPDVAALMWVLEAQPDQPLMPNGSLVGRMGGVMLWADSEEDADLARSMIDKIVEAATREPDPPEPKTTETNWGRAHTESGTSVVPVSETGLEPVKKSWWHRLFG